MSSGAVSRRCMSHHLRLGHPGGRLVRPRRQRIARTVRDGEGGVPTSTAGGGGRRTGQRRASQKSHSNRMSRWMNAETMGNDETTKRPPLSTTAAGLGSRSLLSRPKAPLSRTWLLLVSAIAMSNIASRRARYSKIQPAAGTYAAGTTSPAWMRLADR